MDMLYTIGVQFIFSLQNVFANYTQAMIYISHILDPKYAFFIYTPVLFAFNFQSGKHLLWATVLTEWTNQILKWILFGERPYFWVPEASSTIDLPPIKQFPVTCETGPGSPSGHAMVTATIFYIIFDYILMKKQLQKLRIPIWTTYLFMIITVSISRLYIAAHFPHQCLVGGLLGFLVAKLVLNYRAKFEHASRSQYIMTTLFLFGTAIGTYFALNLMGFDASWSVKKAIKYCNHSSWVHLDNSPLFSLMRYTGFLLGFGLGLHSSFFKQISRLHFTLRMKFTCALISVAVTKLSELIIQPKSNVYLLYLFGFVMSSSLGFIYSAIAPWASTKFTSKLVYRKTSSIENC